MRLDPATAAPARTRAWLLSFLVVLAACDVPTGLPGIEARYRFPVEDLTVPVTGVPAAAAADQDFSGIDLSERVRGATILIRPVNPSGATGTITFALSGGGVSVVSSVDVASSSAKAVELDEAQARALIGGMVHISATGTLCRASGCGLAPPPFPEVRLENELELLVRFGGEG